VPQEGRGKMRLIAGKRKDMERIFNLNEMEKKDIVMTYSGRTAILKDFRNYFDCTVEFDDGTVLPHVNYGCFWFGNVKHPDDTWPMAPEIGETAEVRGRNVSVVDMSSKSNVAFMFDDGKVVTGRAYSDMKRGYFGDIRLNQKGAIENGCYVGEEIVNKKGETATITKVYERERPNSRSARYVDIAFVKDGKKILVEHKNYRTVLGGNVCCPTAKAQKETEEAAESVKDLPKAVRAKDGTLYRLESIVGGRLEVIIGGVLVSRVPVQDYLGGGIKLPKGYAEKKKRIGEKAVSNSGQDMKLVVWRTPTDIDVLVDGEPATHRTYQNFKFGKITSDRYREDLERRVAEEKERKANQAVIARLAKLGRVSINQMGQRMALWKYSSENSVSVIFESGTVVRTTWYAYRNGLVVDPAEEEKAAEAMHKAEVRDDREKARKDIFKNRFTTASEKMAEEAMERTARDVWGRDRKEFMPGEEEDGAYKRACDISRKLDGCATSLRMYSMTAADPIGTLLETMAKAAMNASVKLRRREAAIDNVFGEIALLARTVRKGAEDGTGNLYLDDALRNTADILDKILQ